LCEPQRRRERKECGERHCQQLRCERPPAVIPAQAGIPRRIMSRLVLETLMWSAVACYRLVRRKHSLRTPRKPVPLPRNMTRSFPEKRWNPLCRGKPPLCHSRASGNPDKTDALREIVCFPRRHPPFCGQMPNTSYCPRNCPTGSRQEGLHRGMPTGTSALPGIVTRVSTL
jgi:hypothetical protein